MTDEEAETRYIVSYIEGCDRKRAYAVGLASLDHMTLVVWKLFVVGNMLVAVDIDSELGIFDCVFSMVALSRGSAIYTLPRHLVI